MMIMFLMCRDMSEYPDSGFEGDLEEKKPGTHIPINLASDDNDDGVPLVKKQKCDNVTGGDKQEMLYDEPSTSEFTGVLNTVTVEACNIVEK